MKAGDYPFKDIYDEIQSEAIHSLLEDNGIKRGLTQEKIDGTYVRQPHVTEEFIERERPNYIVDNIKVFYDKYPDMFRRVKDLAQRLISHLKGDRIKLRKYPDVVKAMFEGRENLIPEDMLEEENPQVSPLIERYEKHISRRNSKIKAREKLEEDELEADFVADEEYMRAEKRYLESLDPKLA